MKVYVNLPSKIFRSTSVIYSEIQIVFNIFKVSMENFSIERPSIKFRILAHSNKIGVYFDASLISEFKLICVWQGFERSLIVVEPENSL